MSVSEAGDALSDVAVLRWTGYGLAALSVSVFLVLGFWPNFLWIFVLLAIAVVSLVVVFRAPEAFETLGRGGSRWFNLLVGAPTLLVSLPTLGVQLEDYTVPMAAAAVGAAVLLVAGMIALSRSVMARPLWFLMVAFLMGAVIGYSAFVIVDASFDASPPATLSVPVLDRSVSVSHARGSTWTDYYLLVAPFGARKGAMSLGVSKATYAAYSPGSMVCLLEHRGVFGVPWAVLCDPDLLKVG